MLENVSSRRTGSTSIVEAVASAKPPRSPVPLPLEVHMAFLVLRMYVVSARWDGGWLCVRA